MKILQKRKISPIHLLPGDTVSLTYNDEHVVTQEFDRTLTVDTGVIFEVEPGEFGDDVIDGVGGAFLKTK